MVASERAKTRTGCKHGSHHYMDVNDVVHFSCRYFIEKDGEKTLDSLYEKWFYCDDLGTQLAPIIKG